MPKTTAQFSRWNCHEQSTWPFQVFRRYNIELERLMAAHIASAKYVYSQLGKGLAQWTDLPSVHLPFESQQQVKLFADLRDWSNTFNDFANWTRLNATIAMTANLETYMAAAISLAIESDPGLLLGAPRSIDGLTLLVKANPPLDLSEHIESCTKGDWSARLAAYERLFKHIPSILNRELSDLDKMRKLRNKVSHAFGRDIESSRRHEVKSIIPMERIAADRASSYQRLVLLSAKQIDKHLLSAHIGEYQVLRFYHNLYPSLRKDLHQSERAIRLNKEIGHSGAPSPGKEFSKLIVAYYEKLL